MRLTSIILFVAVLVVSCSTKKTETSAPSSDSTVVDSTLATTPAAAMLAFSPMDGYTPNKATGLPDSVNYFLLANAQDLDQRFTRSGTADPTGAPDFIINYVVAVACAPTPRATTITMEKVVTGESTLDVYLSIARSGEGSTKIRPAQVFAIERREGYPVMQFYVNGKKDKALVLVENQ